MRYINSLLKKYRTTLMTFLITLLGALSSTAFAAGPVTHAYLAEKWNHYQGHYKEAKKDSFILGTLFPDIRYLGVIERTETHVENPTLKSVTKESNPFLQGKTLHAFVDEEREKVTKRWNIYEHLNHIPGQKYKTTFLKLLEDEIFFQKQAWALVKNALEVVDENEKQYKISDENLIKWHELLIKAFTESPSEHLRTLAKRDKYMFDVPPKVIRRWSKILPKLAKDPFILSYVNDLDNHFEKLFSVKEMRTK